MRRHSRATWALLAAALAATLPSGDAHAQNAGGQAGGAAAATTAAAPPKPLSETLTGMPKAEYEAGKVLYADKDYGNAIVKFQRAYELSKDPRLLWNVAVCEKNLRRYARMLTTLRHLLEDGGPLLTDQDKKDADELAKTVEAFVSPLKLTVSEPGAAVFVDDEPIGVSPLEGAVMVDVGTRKIRVTKAGYKEFLRSEQVAGGSDVVIVAKLEKEIHEGRLIVVAGKDDLISIDGKAVGQGRYEGTLASGGHTLRVTAPEMAAHQTEVLIQDGKQRRIDVTLNPAAKSDTATWLWIAGGVALAAGAVVGGVLLFKPTESPSVTGTIEPGTVQLRFGGTR